MRRFVHAAGLSDGCGGYAVTQTTTIKDGRVHKKGGNKMRCDVLSNALHSREIRKRQAAATTKRLTVERSGVCV